MVAKQLIAGIAALVFCGAVCAQNNAIGRYQLVSGSYSFIGLDGVERQVHGLFKMDTATGEIFICHGTALDGNLVGKPGKVINRQTCKKFEQDLTFDASAIPH